MNPIFHQTYEIAPIHTDCFGRTKASALLHFAQEAAGNHCLELVLDWDTLAKKNLFWAVIRTKMQILRQSAIGEKITVETWPMPTTRSAFPRSCVGIDENGNEVFRCISLWVLMDTNKRSMLLPGKSGIALTGTLRGTELAAPGSLHPVAAENTLARKICFTDLDRNGHMNNARYMDWLDDLLPAQFHAAHPVKELTLCYLAEGLEGEKTDIHWTLTKDNILRADVLRPDTDLCKNQSRIFSAEVKF